MLHLWCFYSFGLLFIFRQLNIQYAKAAWPLADSSSIQLLGLFSDSANTTEADNSSVHGEAMFKAAVILSQRYNIKTNGQHIQWQAAQTGGDPTQALRNSCQAVATSNIVGIVGPAFSREATVIAPFAQSIGIPAISYSATNPDLSDRDTYPTFFRTVPSDAAAGMAIVKLFLRYNWTSCIIVYQNDAFGLGGAEVINDAFSQYNLKVADEVVFDIATQSIRGNLKDTLSTSLTRVVILWASSIPTSLILQNALAGDVLGPRFTWILSSSISLNSFNQTWYPKLIGMLTLEPVIGSVVNAPSNTTLLNAAYQIWQQYEPETFPGPTQVNYYALFAFDATWTFIQSLQTLCPFDTNSSSACLSVTNNSFCFDYRFLNTTSFIDTISTTQFLGVSGPVKFSANVTDRTDGIYYVIRNVQPTTNSTELIPVLQWSQSDNWKTYTQSSVVIWPGNTLTIPTGFAGLEGIKLRICMIESTPFTMQEDGTNQNQTNLIGYIPDLIDALQYAMGFIPSIIYPSPNQTYDGLIQAVINGVCDMAIGDITITATRSQVVDFSASIFDNSLRIIIRQTTATDLNLFSYLRPFSLDLWLALLICIIYASILIGIIEREDNEALQNRSIMSSGAMSMWYCFGNLMGYGADFDVRTAAGRLLTVGLYILSLVLAATYTANLASDLTLSKSTDIVSGIDDIKNGKVPFSRVGIRVGTAPEEYYLREISGGMHNFYPLTTQDSLYDALLNNAIDVSLWDIGVLEYAINNIYCNLTLVGSDFGQSTFGIAMPKGWIYERNINVNILLLRESGVFDTLKTKWFERNICQGASSADSADSINFVAMSGLFLTFGVISILSILVFIWTKRFLLKEFLWKSRTRKSSLTEQQAYETSHPRRNLSNHKHRPQSHSVEVSKM